MNAIEAAHDLEAQAIAFRRAGNSDGATAVLNEAIKILEAAYNDAKDDPAEQKLIAAELAKVVGMLGGT